MLTNIIKYISFFAFAISFFNGLSQNLVLNPSFERTLQKKYSCPTLLYLTYVTNWTQSTAGSVDYYRNDRSCLWKDNNINARTGNSFIGQFYIESNRRKRYREYFQGELIYELERNKKYLIEFYVMLSESASTAISGLGAYLNNQIIERKGVWRLRLEPQIVCDTIIDDQNNWVKVSGVYIAAGGEKYVTIGNFEKHKKLKKKKTGYSLGNSSYYYIDDVSVIEIPEFIDTVINDSVAFIANNPLPILPKVEEKRVLKNISFPTNKWDLEPVSFKVLDKFYTYLTKNPFIKAEIIGYTDNKGRGDFNLNLSEKRAKSVVDYLVNKGISETRLIFKGYGSLYPIGDNSTEEGRTKNRRIEIVIKENGEGLKLATKE